MIYMVKTIFIQCTNSILLFEVPITFIKFIIFLSLFKTLITWENAVTTRLLNKCG